MPVFRSLRNAVIGELASSTLRSRFRPDSAFQDFYFDPTGAEQLDLLLGASTDLDISHDELHRVRQAVRQRAALESPTLADRLGALNGQTYTALLESALAIIGSANLNAQWVGMKELWIMDFVPMLARAFPGARFYAIERDPRAVVASVVEMAKKDPTQAAHLPSYMRHWRKSVALSRIFASREDLQNKFRVLSYEGLVADPQSGAKGLCKELAIEYHPEMLDISADGWTGNSSYGDGKGVYSKSVDRWRDLLPADIRLTVDYLCGPEMALTKYIPGNIIGSEPKVKAFLQRAESLVGSWRSGSGDVDAEFAGEILRHELLLRVREPDVVAVRRSYLFEETLSSLLGARALRIGNRSLGANT